MLYKMICKSLLIIFIPKICKLSIKKKETDDINVSSEKRNDIFKKKKHSVHILKKGQITKKCCDVCISTIKLVKM